MEVIHIPFRSVKQMRYMYKFHPDIAKRWEDKYGPYKGKKRAVKRKLVKRRKA